MSSPPEPHFSIKTLEFSDGTALNIDPGEVIVIVGPNNCGKSVALHEIQRRIQNRAVGPAPLVVKKHSHRKEGTTEDLLAWLENWIPLKEAPGSSGGVQAVFGVTFYHHSVRNPWQNPDAPLDIITRLFAGLVAADRKERRRRQFPAAAGYAHSVSQSTATIF